MNTLDVESELMSGDHPDQVLTSLAQRLPAHADLDTRDLPSESGLMRGVSLAFDEVSR